MQKRLNTFFALSLVAFASVVAFTPGCSDENGTTPDGCYDYAGFQSDARTVSFQTDVLPIFRQSCAFAGSCHGSPTPPAPERMYLGNPTIDGPMMQADIDKIFTQNVGVNASKATTMKLVDPGSPQTSFLMHKMDNTLTCSAVTCDSGCGGPMPLGSPVLGANERETVRLWIAQGAKND